MFELIGILFSLLYWGTFFCFHHIVNTVLERLDLEVLSNLALQVFEADMGFHG